MTTKPRKQYVHVNWTNAQRVETKLTDGVLFLIMYVFYCVYVVTSGLSSHSQLVCQGQLFYLYFILFSFAFLANVTFYV